MTFVRPISLYVLWLSKFFEQINLHYTKYFRLPETRISIKFDYSEIIGQNLSPFKILYYSHCSNVSKVNI